MPIKVTYPRPTGLRERWVDDSGNLLSNIHPETSACREYGCALHRPSDHEYSHLPLVWDSLNRMFMRVDEAEGEDYPDPDELAFRERMAAQGIKGPLWDNAPSARRIEPGDIVSGPPLTQLEEQS